MESIHQKLERIRKPRVHIKYDVETEHGIEQKELPFVVGVIGDLLGNHPKNPTASLKERRFTQVDRDNFDTVMANLGPGLDLRVANTLTPGDTEINAQLQFNSLADFEPENLIQQIEPLRALLDLRQKLTQLSSKADRSDELESLLETVLKNPDAIAELAEQLAVAPKPSTTLADEGSPE